MRRRLGALIAVLLGGIGTAHADRPEWESLAGLPIVDVQVEASEVFDRTSPGQDHAVLDWANALHMVTRPKVIRREYAQSIGDPFDPRLAADCERNLRGLGIFQDVHLVATPQDGGVEVVVRTVDRWSLRAHPVLRLQGGLNEVGMVVGERNMLGLGFEVGAAAVYSNDVNQAAFKWRDRRFLASRLDAGFDLYFDELGHSQGYRLALPFHSDTVRWTADAGVGLTDGDRRLFEAGEEVERLNVEEKLVESAVSRHWGRQHLGRIGLFESRRHAGGDVTNDVAAVGLVWSVLQRDFSYCRDVDQLGNEEEVSRGWSLQLGAGADLQAFGATRDRFLYRAEAQAGTFLRQSVLLGAFVRHHGFVDGGHVADGRLLSEIYGFWKESPAGVLAWRLGAQAAIDEPVYVRFDLGSDDRLRGYEARALNGTRVLYGSLEQRLFGQHRFSFLRLGAVAFVDAAAAWDEGEQLDRSQARLGTGIGLRLGTDPTGNNLTRIDLGFGTNSVEVGISSGSFFDVTRSLSFPSAHLFE